LSKRDSASPQTARPALVAHGGRAVLSASKDVHELWAELEAVRRDVKTLENQLGPQFVNLYSRLEAARAREAELLQELAG